MLNKLDICDVYHARAFDEGSSVGFTFTVHEECTGQAWYMKSLNFLWKCMIMYGILPGTQDV